MAISQARFDALAERAIEVMWKQWLSLGANLSGEPVSSVMIDPEALLMATCTIGRHEVRLFDEALDWLVINYKLLSANRLIQLMRTYPESDRRVLAAVDEWVAARAGTEMAFKGLRRSVERPEDYQHTKPLWTSGARNSPREPDAVFRSWGLLRGAARLRRHSKPPDLHCPANVMLSARAVYGKGVRADVLAYLCCIEKAQKNSRSIAGRLYCDQTGVLRALKSLMQTGVVENLNQAGRGASGYYRIKSEAALEPLGIKSRPLFANWPELYRTINEALADVADYPSAWESELLAGERARDITASVVPRMRKSCDAFSELPVPEIAESGPRSFVLGLLGFLDAAMTKAEDVIDAQVGERDRDMFR